MSITVRTEVSSALYSSAWRKESGSNASKNLLITGPTAAVYVCWSSGAAHW
jgi:hypothetical protein